MPQYPITLGVLAAVIAIVLGVLVLAGVGGLDLLAGGVIAAGVARLVA